MQHISVFTAVCICASILFHQLIPDVSAAGAPPQRPATLRFAFIHDTVDEAFRGDAVQVYTGLKAAEKEVNDANLIPGTDVVFDFFPTLPQSDTRANRFANISAALGNPSPYMAAVASDWGTTPLLYEAASQQSLPVIGSRSLTEFELSNRTFESIVSYRLPITSELRAMLHHATTDETGQYSRFVLVRRSSLFPNVTDVFMTSVRGFGFDDPFVYELDANSSVLDSVALRSWWAALPYPAPLCGVFLALPSDVKTLLADMFGDAARFPDFGRMAFYAASPAIAPAMLHSSLGTAPYRRLFYTSSFSNPDLVVGSQLAPIASQYQAAQSAWLASGPTLPAALQATGVAADAAANMASMEGYVVGRFLASVLRSSANLTRQGFLDTLYTNSYFWSGDDLLGPFRNRCLVSDSLVMPCFCNVASQTIHVLGVDGTTGRPTTVATDDISTRTAHLSIGASECVMSDADLPHPIVVQLLPTQPPTPASTADYRGLFTTMRLHGEKDNRANVVPNAAFTVSLFENDTASLLAVANRSLRLATMFRQRRPMVVVGDWFDAPDVTVPVLNIHLSAQMVLAEPPVSAATEFTKFTWLLKPTFAEYVHAGVLLLQQVLVSAPVVRIVASDVVSRNLVVRSLNTIQWTSADDNAATVDLSAYSAVLATIHTALAEAAASSSTAHVVVFFACHDAASVINIVNAAAAAASGGSSGAFSKFAIVVATDPNYLYGAKFQLTNYTPLLQFPVYFSSFMTPFFEAGNPYRVALQQLLNTSSPAVLESVELHTGNAIMSLISSVVQQLTTTTFVPTAADVVNYIYDVGTLTAGGVVFGPFHATMCTAAEIALNAPDRTCQCFRPITAMRGYDFRGWLTGSAVYNPQFSWARSTCGIVYQPLAVAATLNAAMIAGIAAPCGVVLCVAVWYFACCFGRRNNWDAPKNAHEPFAMVFTDIQSSTSLWARAPEAMGTALETHHAILRRLVSRHNGYEVKTIGDSFMVAFKKASDAARFGLAIQTALFAFEAWPVEIDDVYVSLAQEQWEAAMEQSKGDAAAPATGQPWSDEATYFKSWNGIRVRVGMHWGTGSIKLDPVSQGFDYYGTVVNTAARVEGVGNGGQVLATRDLFVRLEEESFELDGVDVVPLGPQPLRGLDAPVALFQLTPDALRARQYAPLRLDFELEEDSTDDTGTAVLGDGTITTSSGGGGVTTPEGLLDRLLRHQRPAGTGSSSAHPHDMRDDILKTVQFVKTALRTSPAAWQQETVKQLLKRWHIQRRHPPASLKESADTTMVFDLVSLCTRVSFAAEEAASAVAHRKPSDVRSTANSRHFGNSMTMSGTLGGRGSIYFARRDSTAAPQEGQHGSVKNDVEDL